MQWNGTTIKLYPPTKNRLVSYLYRYSLTSSPNEIYYILSQYFFLGEGRWIFCIGLPPGVYRRVYYELPLELIDSTGLKYLKIISLFCQRRPDLDHYMIQVE